MVRRGKWKYIHYAAAEVADLLFDLEADPAELHNRAGEEPAVAAELLALARRDWDPEGIAETVLARRRHVRIITHWAFQVHPDNPDLCVDSVRGLALPEVR
jgi:arylsulfatase A-like enzyme